MIRQHIGKLAIKEIEEISRESDCLVNFFYSNRFPNFPGKYLTFENGSLINICSFDVIKKLGKPNCHMQGYESYPGAWVLYDNHGIIWLVFSDGIRKNRYKGTSYELVVPDSIAEKEFDQAVQEFFAFLGVLGENNETS